MITIIIHGDETIEVLYPPGEELPHIVVVDMYGEWTDSPAIFTEASEDEQAEQLAEYRNGGFEDRNP